MSDDDDPAIIIEAARRWGTQRGRLLATDSEIREAVQEGREVDWFEHPEIMWTAIGLTEEVKMAAEELHHRPLATAEANPRARVEPACLSARGHFDIGHRPAVLGARGDRPAGVTRHGRA